MQTTISVCPNRRRDSRAKNEPDDPDHQQQRAGTYQCPQDFRQDEGHGGVIPNLVSTRHTNA